MGTSAPLGFAIVGTGMIAAYHAQALAQTPGARVVAVVSRSAERGQAFAAKHGVPQHVVSVEEAVALAGVDALTVATPSGLHLEPALLAIEAGKHVVVEKPLEILPERADKIIEAARERGVRLATIFQSRFSPAAQRMKAAVVAERFGRLTLASVSVKWHRTAEYYDSAWKGRWQLDGGGALMNQAIHGVDLLQWFAGMPREVSGRFTRRLHTNIEADDTTVAHFAFPSGALGTLEASTAAWPGWSRRIELCGEHGCARLEDDRITSWEFARPEPGDAEVTAGREASQGSGAGSPGGISLAGHVQQFQDLVDSIHAGRAPAVDGAEGRKSVAFVCAIYESARTGAPVLL